ncbi:hypothetical protein [Erwinia sp. MYb535]|uniref:hypothetical protein n=1 Tax=Erwinia sp. MYb535 TaxID=2745309 RepID=UPI003097BC0F
MEKRGTSDRHLAAALAMLFAMGQGNVFYPLIPFGLHWGEAVIISIVGGLAAAAFTYHLSGRRLSTDSLPLAEKERLEGNAPQGPSLTVPVQTQSAWRWGPFPCFSCR